MILNIRVSNMRGVETLYADSMDNIVTYNNEKRDIDPKMLILEILTTIRDCPKTLVNTAVIDGLEYHIVVTNSKKKVEFLWKNSFPDNINEFNAILQAVKNV